MRILAILAAVGLVVAGCLGGGTKSESEAAESGGTLLVLDETTGENITLAAGMGAITGKVLDDAGTPLGGANVGLLATDLSARANKLGKFRILNISEGQYTLRAELNGYQALEEVITVKANTVLSVLLVLVPANDVGAGYRPHLHDYWADRSEVQVISKDFDWHEPYDKHRPYAGYDQVSRYYNLGSQAAGVNPCIYQGEPYFNDRHIWFDDTAQLVWAGTGGMELTLRWAAADASPLLDSLRFAYRAGSQKDYNISEPIKNGATIKVDVTPDMWDSSHQVFTLWSMVLCMRADNENGQFFIGRVHVDMKLHKGYDVTAEPAHPDFWGDGTTYSVVDGQVKKYTSQTYSLYRTGSNGAFVFKPASTKIVPPGSLELKVRLEWKYSLATGTKAWSLTYRPANVNPYEAREDGVFKSVPPSEKGTNFRLYVIPLKPEETDAFYQKRSNWFFFLNHEGEENDWYWVNHCGCEIEVKLTVDAIGDPGRAAAEKA